jgi:hypothetical protein
MSYLTKFKLILDPRLTMANFWDKAAGVFSDQPVAYLTEPLDYKFNPTDVLTFNEVLAFVNRLGNVRWASSRVTES